jgi:hypothetical protein
LGYTDSKDNNQKTIQGEVVRLFDHAKVVFLDRPYCELEEGRRDLTFGSNSGSITHDLRGVYAGAYDFDAYFRIVLDDLLVREGGMI